MFLRPWKGSKGVAGCGTQRVPRRSIAWSNVGFDVTGRVTPNHQGSRQIPAKRADRRGGILIFLRTRTNGPRGLKPLGSSAAGEPAIVR